MIKAQRLKCMLLHLVFLTTATEVHAHTPSVPFAQQSASQRIQLQSCQRPLWEYLCFPVSSILNTQYTIYLRIFKSDPHHYKLMIHDKENVFYLVPKYIIVSFYSCHCWQAIGSFVCNVNQDVCEWSVGLLNK